MNRTKILIAFAVVLALVGIVRLLWPDGTITVNFKDAPLSKVIAEVERQGRVDIVTNVPPETPVTLQLQRAPLMVALETLSARVDGDLRPSIISAPNRTRIREAVSHFETGKRSPDWVISWSRGGFNPGSPTQIDPRALPVAFEPAEPNDLQGTFRQVAAKSGLLIAAPKDWNPSIGSPKSPAPAAEMVRQATKAAKGKSTEVFVIVGSTERSWGDQRAGAEEGPGRDRMAMNPEWIAARAAATIAQLPPEDRAAAKAEFDSLQAVFKEVAALPQEQRREKMAEVFSRPEFQERMEERQAARDTLRSPEQRAQRYERYLQRKAAAQQAQR